MALIVALLRLAMLLLNMYDSFKVLKYPRGSARASGGQPSMRALTQRKRNMKGCLAVWIVWCCFMSYERMAEGIVSLFIPFYDEFKTLVLLFLIFTRARGAEPIYLHVIRPLLRPYTSTVDSIFDVARMFGDIVFLLSAYPFHFASTWWHNTFGHSEEPADTTHHSNLGLYADVQQALHSVSCQVTPGQSVNGERPSGRTQTSPRPRVPTDRSDANVGSADPSRGNVHEIWHPPRSSYHDEDGDEPDIKPLEPASESLEAQREREQIEEWRQYPPFPSAYPPTPILPPPSRLPLPPLYNAPVVPPRFSPIPEDIQPLADFGLSLQSTHEPLDPGSVGDLSDEDNVLGIRHASLVTDVTMTFRHEVAQDDDDEEDDFDVTLRTPGRAAASKLATTRVTRSQAKQSLPASPDSSEFSLTTLPSLLSRISSDTSSVSDDSSISSLIGHKRSRDFITPNDPKSTLSRGRTVIKRTQRQKVPALAVVNPLEGIEDESSVATSSSASEGDSDVDKDTGISEGNSPLSKRRRMAFPPSRVQPRRATRTASQDPSDPHPRQRQRQPKSLISDGPGARASSRLAGVVPAVSADPAPRRRRAAASVERDAPGAEAKAAPARKAPGAARTTSHRK
ncbi:hypothetical protein C8J57DRAFT_1139911 [Mycena rebaudengoi]|nr:hypothetical protein C8J57DRAFT_1139911 [Mycena rebaudengoi]